MDLEQAKQALQAAKDRAYAFKTKKAQDKAWLVVKELRRQILDELYIRAQAYARASMKATVRHFTPRDDHYLVETSVGNMWLSPANDELTKSWYSHTCCVEYTKGQTIVLEYDVEVDTERLVPIYGS